MPTTRVDAVLARRAALAALVVVASVIVLVLIPGAGRSHAADLMAELRGAGIGSLTVGHRGDRAEAPENTLPAFAAAFAAGVPVVEADVQLSADGVAVLIHDETVDRTTDGSGTVAMMTVDALRALDAGSWYGSEFAGTRIPLLAEFLDLLAGAPSIAILELKGYWTVDEIGVVLREIDRSGTHGRVVLGGFHLGTIENALAADPDTPRVIIRRQPADPVALAERFDAIAVVTTVRAVQRDPGIVDALNAAGRGLLLYTLNGESRWRIAFAAGADGIITDRPEALDAWLGRTRAVGRSQ